MSRDDAPRAAGTGEPRTVPCPTCGKMSAFEPWNPWRPFCSQRCRVADLGAWASESYRVPGKPADDEPADGTPDPEA